MLFGMTHRIRHTIRNHLIHELTHDATDQQQIEAESHLTPTELINMILLDQRSYTIKFVATYTNELFSCHEVASSGTTNVCSVCVSVCVCHLVTECLYLPTSLSNQLTTTPIFFPLIAP